jgi:hypothetical protein
MFEHSQSLRDLSAEETAVDEKPKNELPPSADTSESSSTVNEAALVRKLDLHLLPPLTLLYLLSFLDRSNGKLTCLSIR